MRHPAHRSRALRRAAPLTLASLCGLGAMTLSSATAEAQTRVLVLADGSTMFSAVSYYNSAVSEFAAVVGAPNVQGRNDLSTVTLTAADLHRPDGGSYDVIVLVTSFNGIGTANWTLLRDAVRTRAARSFVLFSDHCSICSADNVDGGNGNGLVPLLNAAGGWMASIGTLRTAQLPVPLNTGSPLSRSFVGMNPMQTYDYHSMNGIPSNNALYLAPSATVPPAGTTRIDDVTAVLVPTSESYGGFGACVFGIADVNPLAIPGNPGRIGPAFVDAITSAMGSCASGPLVITGPAAGTVTNNPRPVISGVAQPGATVTVSVGGQTLTATAAADGSWSVTPAALAEGPYTATATRSLGGIVQTASTSFTVSICGNGAIAGDERCDDGNNSPGDGCSAACTVERGYVCHGDRSTCAITCGDGVRAASEACDDGNTTEGDGCSAACAIEPGYGCSNPDATVFYAHRGLSDCVVVPGFEPMAPTATVPARLAVSGVGVWSSYRARYVTGSVDFSDHPTSYRAPTLLQFDPGAGARAALFGGFTMVGQTSRSIARTVAERATYDFGVGVAGSVRAATPDIAGACSNNSDDAIAYRIDSMSVCAPTCTDSSPTGTDMGCTADAPHCRSLTGGGATCVQCTATNACATGVCDVPSGTCHAVVDAGTDAPLPSDVIDASDVADASDVPDLSDVIDVSNVPDASDAPSGSDAADASDAVVASDAMDAASPVDAVAVQDVPTVQDVPSAQDVVTQQDVPTAQDVVTQPPVTAVQGDGCGCRAGGSTRGTSGPLGVLATLAVALGRRRRRGGRRARTA